MFKKEDKNKLRKAKHDRIRHTLVGTTEKPRLNVYRSVANIYVQVIDDSTGKTLCSASTLDKELASKLEGKNKKEQAYVVGEAIAKKAAKAKVKQVVFDRGGYIYTGRVQSLAEGARSAGLEF
ncbi:MAG: 50S ribosomal protein L18 [Clostridia bacterium]|nr:50S ribosomal protein L18 [Clostridia bacterium]